MCFSGQERKLSKLSSSMMEGTCFSKLGDVLKAGVELVGVATPGFALAIMAFKGVYDLASSFLGCAEESARLMTYCGAMATALSRFNGKVRETPELTAALNEAAEALQQLRASIDGHMTQSTFEKMFTSSSFISASEQMKQDVEKAVRKAMDEAQLQGMEDAAKTRENVELLLMRRCVEG
jgi:hypothetical protein